MPSAKTPEERQALMRQQAALTALSEHPSWPDLEQAVEDNYERIRKEVLVITMGPKAADQRRLDYLRGFVHGMRWFAQVPKTAERDLVTYLRKQGVEMNGGRE